MAGGQWMQRTQREIERIEQDATVEIIKGLEAAVALIVPVPEALRTERMQATLEAAEEALMRSYVCLGVEVRRPVMPRRPGRQPPGLRRLRAV